MENKELKNIELIKVESKNMCEGCYYSNFYTDGFGCEAPTMVWNGCLRETKNHIYIVKSNTNKTYYEPYELIEGINEAELACRPKGFYKDLSNFTNKWVSDKIKETWIKSTGHNPSYDTYIPFELSNGITYIAYYTKCQVVGLVMLHKKSLKRCYFVNSSYQRIEVTNAENESIEFCVVSNVKKVEFKLNK